MPACPETERFAALLRSLKSRSGLSYEALARKSGLSGSTLHRYCRGTSVPQDYGSVHRLATVCGAAPDELRTLHRLWALADAARNAAAGAEDEGVGRKAGEEPEREAGRKAGEEPEREAGRKAAEEPEQDAGRGARREAGPETGHGDEQDSGRDGEQETGGSAVRDPAGEPADTDARQRPVGPSRRRRLRTSVLVAAVVAAVSVSAWALTNGRTPSGSGSGGGGRGPGDGRPLFSANCPPVIAMGEHDECVQEVQRLLHAKGADIDVDGNFGPQTLRRVTAFQVLTGLRPNGVVAEPTKKALYTSDVRMGVWPPEKVRERVREVFPEVPDKAVAIADCQSFLDPLHILPNTNGTRNWGLFQISDARLRELGGTPRQALDPEWNIQAARKLWSRERDFGDWPHCARAAGSTPSPTSSGSS
ncbi:helix-turn-helix domain-containing protein [Streptomyces sp. NRRL S-481]|uniref:helix-turn-helix domain-containing protein n=1 Tax=Streptomyces sp. NRRL S-481 TaxID=1463911 RepID=UPI0004C9C079|nr:helix-turn-helix domain-containing protein [Streptomyces sp. NRRL S-481]